MYYLIRKLSINILLWTLSRMKDIFKGTNAVLKPQNRKIAKPQRKKYAVLICKTAGKTKCGFKTARKTKCGFKCGFEPKCEMRF